MKLILEKYYLNEDKTNKANFRKILLK